MIKNIIKIRVHNENLSNSSFYLIHDFFVKSWFIMVIELSGVQFGLKSYA